MTSDREHDGIVDWHRTARRVRRVGAAVVVLVVAAWVVAGLAGDGLRLADLGDWVGLGLGIMVVTEVVVVGGAAVRAERRAAVRGERLGSRDVGLLPPRPPRPSTLRSTENLRSTGEDDERE